MNDHHLLSKQKDVDHQSIGLSKSSLPPSSLLVAPLIISIVGVVLAILSMLAYHYFLIRYCLKRQIQNENHQPGDSTRDGNINSNVEEFTGVEANILNKIPILGYEATQNLFRVQQAECVICLECLEDGVTVRLLPKCGHFFHVSCIDEWLTAHTSCPFCRSEIVAALNHEEEPFIISIPNEIDQYLVDGGISSSSNSNASSHRHSVSLVLLPKEREHDCELVTGLRRSLSLDRVAHHHVVIDIGRESEKGSSSSSSS
ncbi:hypothetical protein ACFE04_000838 [Oxalis oulophora]